ncbi:cytochrome P450 2J2-like [Glandiceps talaboti]
MLGTAQVGGILQTALQTVDVTAVLIGLVVMIIASWFIQNYGPMSNYRNGKKMPPRPPVLPIIGNLHLIFSRSPWKDMMTVAKKYGNVYRMQLGTKEVVVLNGYDEIKQALLRQQEHFSERPVNIQTEILAHNGRGTLHSEGLRWHEQRKFTQRMVRDFGWGKTEQFAKAIENEIQIVMKELIDPKKGAGFDIGTMFQYAVCNVQNTFVFGQRFEYTDKDALEFMDALNGFSTDTNPAGVMTLLPLLTKVPFGAAKRVLDHIFTARKFARNQIKKKKGIRDRLGKKYKPEKKSYIDVYLDECEAQKDRPELDFNEESVIIAVLDVYFGNQTVGDVLAWALLMMVQNPESQRKVQAELDRVVGRDREPNVADRPQLHYVEAVLLELIRIRPISPFGIPHMTSEDSSLYGMHIPAKTYILTNFWSVQGDEKFWTDAERFIPERNIDENGEFKQHSHVYLPFGIGPRSCLGQALARAELFLFFCTLLHRYNFTMDDDLGNKQSIGMTQIRPYNISAKRRVR